MRFIFENKVTKNFLQKQTKTGEKIILRPLYYFSYKNQTIKSSHLCFWK